VSSLCPAFAHIFRCKGQCYQLRFVDRHDETMVRHHSVDHDVCSHDAALTVKASGSRRYIYFRNSIHCSNKGNEPLARVAQLLVGDKRRKISQFDRAIGPCREMNAKMASASSLSLCRSRRRITMTTWFSVILDSGLRASGEQDW
jgi:hypothetical protein